MYTSAATGRRMSSSIRNLLCLFLVIESEKAKPSNRISSVIMVSGIGPNNRLSFGCITTVKPSSKLVEVDSIFITSPHGYLECEKDMESVSNNSALPKEVKTEDFASTVMV